MRWSSILLFVATASITLGGTLAVAQQPSRVTAVDTKKRLQSLQLRADAELGKLSTLGVGSSSADRAAFEEMLRKELASVGISLDPAKLADLAQGMMKGGSSAMAIALVIAFSIAELAADADSSTTTDDSGRRGDPRLRAQMTDRLRGVGAGRATPQVVEGWLAQPGTVAFTSADFEVWGKLPPAEGMKTLRDATNKRFAAALERKR